MARDLHRHPFPDSRAHHVAHATATEVVKEPARDPLLGAVRVDADDLVQAGLHARRCPGLAEVAHGAAGAVEDELGDADRAIRALELPRLPATLDNRAEVALDRDRAAPAVLRMLGPQPDHPAGPIDVGPAQRHELAAAPSREIRDASEVLQVVGERGHDLVRDVRLWVLAEAIVNKGRSDQLEEERPTEFFVPMHRPRGELKLHRDFAEQFLRRMDAEVGRALRVWKVAYQANNAEGHAIAAFTARAWLDCSRDVLPSRLPPRAAKVRPSWAPRSRSKVQAISIDERHAIATIGILAGLEGLAEWHTSMESYVSGSPGPISQDDLRQRLRAGRRRVDSVRRLIAGAEPGHTIGVYPPEASIEEHYRRLRELSAASTEGPAAGA